MENLLYVNEELNKGEKRMIKEFEKFGEVFWFKKEYSDEYNMFLYAGYDCDCPELGIFPHDGDTDTSSEYHKITHDIYPYELDEDGLPDDTVLDRVYDTEQNYREGYEDICKEIMINNDVKDFFNEIQNNNISILKSLFDFLVEKAKEMTKTGENFTLSFYSYYNDILMNKNIDIREKISFIKLSDKPIKLYHTQW